MNQIKKILLCIGFWSFVINPDAKSQLPPVNVQDSLILVEFYNATNGDTWTNNDNWLVTPVYFWHGVSLLEYYRVLWLELPNNNLNGFISPLLCQLTMLYFLNLTGNNLSGPIPECIGELHYMTALLLDNNHLSGTLPNSLGYRADSLMLTLGINNNNFEGEFPDTIIKSDMIGYLDISGNKFTSIGKKNFSWLFQLFYMENNCFTFEDIIPYKLEPINGIFTYSPQDSVLSKIDTTLLVGSALVMDAWVDTCSNNRYRWKKNGNFLNLAPSANPLWPIPSVQYSDSVY